MWPRGVAIIAIWRFWSWPRRKAKHGSRMRCGFCCRPKREKQTIVNRESFREFLDRCEQAPDITDVQIADVSLASFDQLFSQPGALQ
jgi:hypothetical protein